MPAPPPVASTPARPAVLASFQDSLAAFRQARSASDYQEALNNLQVPGDAAEKKTLKDIITERVVGQKEVASSLNKVSTIISFWLAAFLPACLSLWPTDRLTDRLIE